MAETKNTIEALLARLVVDVDNMNAFLLNLNTMLESKSENVTISQTLEDGSTKEISVPSFGYLKSKIDNVNTNFETLISANDDVIGIRSANGDVRKFEMKKVSKLIQELEAVAETSVEIPTSFGVKNNWFFESFLNPLLFVSVDVQSVLTDDIDQFSVKRLIINSIDDDEITFFNETYLNNNTIDLDEARATLEEQGIDFFEDDNIVPMPIPVNRFKGSFDILRIMEEDVDQVIVATGETVTIPRRRYKLSTLNYTDVLDEQQNTRILAEGDILMTDEDSEYKVVSVNKTDTEIVLERIFGLEPITIGADILRMKPVRYRAGDLQINVGYNEREIIFVRPISKAQNLTIDDYSKGFGVFSNELTITLEDESESTLEQYYTNFVADFGMILLSAAKEKKLPAIVAEEPDAPLIDAANFEVVQIDKHIKEDEDEAEIKGQIAEKENLKVRVKENLKKIDDLKAKLNDTQKSTSEKNRIEKKITSSVKEKATLQSQLSSTVRDLTTKLSTTPSFNRKPKYKVRGFWPMPEAKDSTFGTQEVVQFRIRYRYLSKKGTAPNATQSRIRQTDETESIALFSPWTEVMSKSRTKELNETTGLYEWSTEDLSSSEEVNANQLDISIRKGENLEIQVQSLCEAGWPDNAVVSEWSDSVQVAFPEEIMSAEEATVISQRLFAEEARLDFEDELTSRGLDLHLGNQFTTGERFFAHQAKDVASGFFTSEGNIIDLFVKLQTLQTTVESLEQALSVDKGVIKVSVIDDQGNVSEVKNGDTLKLFAGYYRDQIKDTSGTSVVYNDGRVITKQYAIQIENTSATQLELITLMKGGIEQPVIGSNPGGNPESDYHNNRRYDLVPLSINSATEGDKGDYVHPSGNQSQQVNSQYIHSRYLNYGLSTNLYDYYPVGGSTYATGPINIGNLYDGTSITHPLTLVAENVPINGNMYVPFRPGNPNKPTGGTWNSHPDIWIGQTDSGAIPLGFGYMNEFSIHKDHPELQNYAANINVYSNALHRYNLFGLYDVTVGAPQSYLKFAHAVFLETSVNEKTGILSNPSYLQANRETALVTTNPAATTNNHFPIKLGFTPNDEYLIGKFTCGSYLYMFPNSYEDISVEGNHPALSAKQIDLGSENSVNIPVLFQYRCSDKLSNIGGFRTNETLKNIKYSKKIGIDIFIKEDIPFSFDIEVSTQYKKETTLDSPIVPSRGAIPVTF
jgi:hypothetical protein